VTVTPPEPRQNADSDAIVDDQHQASFGALARVFGSEGYSLLPQLRFCVVGLGGVGSWAAESLVRTGIGHLTMIDHDDIAVIEVMKERLADIHPTCDVRAEDDFLVENNLDDYLDREFDVVIDAIDNIRFKAAMIAFCRRRKIRIITTGGAGGRTDPLAIDVADLSRTWNDALAAKVRSRLRSDYGFTNNPKRRFGIECVYSHEQPVYPSGDGRVTHAKPGVPGVRLDCELGYGSVGYVTGTFGLVAASRAVNRALAQRLRRN